MTANETPYIRVGKTLSKIDNLTPVSEKLIVSLINLLVNRSTVNIKKPFMEAQFNYDSKDSGKFRVLISRSSDGYMLAVSPVHDDIPEMDSLNLPHRMKQLIHVQSGLLLIIGKRNSGKSSTVASLVDFINKNYSKRIMVMENSLTYLHKDWLSTIKQSFFRASDILNLSNAEFDKTIGDSSVVALDGFPMYETIRLSLVAARKGVLVIASSDINGGVSEALRLMIECFDENDRNEAKKTLSATLKALIWQTLLPKNDGTGVMPIFEMLINDPIISSQIYNERFHLIRPTMAAGSSRGMVTISQALAGAGDFLNKDAMRKFRDDTYSYYVNSVKEAYY
ncbi:MAG: hypothetical protein L7F77_06795 [Candidatus Magnetominusculus sp. LBB02]|nr:hypothetical protein [Candidatus Magnetominusculus sp. LBB02]